MSRTSRELIAKFFNMLKNFMRIFSPKYFARLSRDSRATFVRVSRTCRREILANLQCEIFATLVRMSRECRLTVARQSCENLATIWQENKTKRHSYECRATLARMSRDCRTNLNENKLHSRESRETPSRQSRDIFSKLDRNSRICRKNVYSMRLQRESCVYTVYLCREIVANYSRTSLQLSHSSEIGA